MIKNRLAGQNQQPVDRKCAVGDRLFYVGDFVKAWLNKKVLRTG
jgi:hypothetical protein